MVETKLYPITPGVMLPEVGLAPCPFCGSDASIEHDTRSIHKSYWLWHVRCIEIECEAVGPAAETERGARQLWNSRGGSDD